MNSREYYYFCCILASPYNKCNLFRSRFSRAFSIITGDLESTHAQWCRLSCDGGKTIASRAQTTVDTAVILLIMWWIMCGSQTIYNCISFRINLWHFWSFVGYIRAYRSKLRRDQNQPPIITIIKRKLPTISILINLRSFVPEDLVCGIITGAFPANDTHAR